MVLGNYGEAGMVVKEDLITRTLSSEVYITTLLL
jgi:hypothetical protein